MSHSNTSGWTNLIVACPIETPNCTQLPHNNSIMHYVLLSCLLYPPTSWKSLHPSFWPSFQPLLFLHFTPRVQHCSSLVIFQGHSIQYICKLQTQASHHKPHVLTELKNITIIVALRTTSTGTFGILKVQSRFLMCLCLIKYAVVLITNKTGFNNWWPNRQQYL